MSETRAINRYIGSSPRKMRLVIDLIRGKSVPEALTILHYSPKHPAKVAEKVLRSAVSNFQNKDQEGRTEIESLFVKRAYVDPGPSMKRILPAPMGRAYRIVKRSNHLTIVVDKRAARARGKAAAAAPAQGAKTQAAKPQTAKPQAAKAKTNTSKE
ncbi:MAG TPA: 50S ribosomal protein L22 [Bacteroidota bacterium]|nr:50S ribosomal protein L22 [Bacteroidota bacterium]